MTTSSCPLCGAPAASDERLGALGFDRCEQCSFVFRPDALQLAQVYADGDYGQREAYHGDLSDPGQRRNARRRLNFVRRRWPGGRLLDVGAGGGQFVALAAQEGFQATGIEPSPAFARNAREVLGAEVVEGQVEDATLPAGSQDVITLWHVLEHIADPVAVLVRLRPALASGGGLVIEVPNAESVAAERMGRNWPHLDPDVHVCQFTGATLRLALENAGLEVAELESVSHSSYLSPLERVAPRSLAHDLVVAVRGGRRPLRHEFLRATAVAAADSISAP